MKKLALILFCIPAFMFADLAFPDPYQDYCRGHYFIALQKYNELSHICTLTQIQLFEIVLGKSMCSGMINELNSHFADHLFCQCEDKEKYTDILILFTWPDD